MATAQDSKVLGVVVLVRHGDRQGICGFSSGRAVPYQFQGFYQDPTSYTASDTAITPLGNVRMLPLKVSLS